MTDPAMLVAYLKEKVNALETMDQIMSAPIERLKVLMDRHYEAFPNSKDHHRPPNSEEEKQALWDVITACLAFYAIDEGMGAFFGIIPGTVPPIPSAEIHALGFPRQIARGQANVGVIIHHGLWAETEAYSQASTEREVSLPSDLCGNATASFDCFSGFYPKGPK